MHIISEWNLLNPQGPNEVPKIADFLGVGNSETHHSPDLTAFSDMSQGGESDYLFSGNGGGLMAVQNTVAAATNSSQYDQYQENSNNCLQSLTLSMGSSGQQPQQQQQPPSSTNNCETSGDNNSTASVAASTAATVTTAITPVVEATPRRTLDTFGQRTSIYRGVTR